MRKRPDLAAARKTVKIGAPITYRPGIGLRVATLSARGGLKPKDGQRSDFVPCDDRTTPGGA